ATFATSKFSRRPMFPTRRSDVRCNLRLCWCDYFGGARVLRKRTASWPCFLDDGAAGLSGVAVLVGAELVSFSCADICGAGSSGHIGCSFRRDSFLPGPNGCSDGCGILVWVRPS